MVFTALIDIQKTKVPLSKIDKVRLSQVVDDVQLVTALTVCFLQLPSVSRRPGSIFSNVQKWVVLWGEIWKFFIRFVFGENLDRNPSGENFLTVDGG